MPVATSDRILSDVCVKTLAHSFISQLLEEARFYTAIAMDSGLPWKDVLKADVKMKVDIDDETVQKVEDEKVSPTAMQGDRTASFKNETINITTSQKEQERKEVLPEIVEHTRTCTLNEVEKNDEDEVVASVTLTGSKEDEINENFLNSTDLENSSLNCLNRKDSGKDASNIGLLERTYLILNREEQTSDAEIAEMVQPERMALQDVKLLTESTSDEETPSKNETESSVLKNENFFRRVCVQGRKMFLCLRNFAKKLTPSVKSSKQERDVLCEECLSEERNVKKYRLEVEVPSPEGTWKMADCGDGKVCLETEV